MSKKSLLFFCPTLGGGGAEMHLARLVNAIDRDRFDITLVLARPGGSYESMLSAPTRIIYCTRRIRSSTLSMMASVFGLRRILKTRKPDLAMSVMDLSNFVLYFASKLAFTKVNLVYNVQTSPYYSMKIDSNFATKITYLLGKLIYPSAKRIIALSEGVKYELNSKFGTPLERITTINNIVETSESIPSPNSSLKNFDEPFRLVSAGRLVALKGYQHLIRAIAIVNRTHNVQLSIFGEGPYRRELESLIEKFELGESVRLMGFTSNLNDELLKRDLFVLSSLYEGFGNVIVEAMAMGVPVLATDCPYGPGEIITHGVNGWLTEPGNAEQIAADIRNVMTNKESIAKIRKMGFLRAKDFSPELLAKAYEQTFLEEILHNS